MIGTIVNTGTILVGSCVGAVLRRGIRPQYRECLYNAMGLAAVGLGANAVVGNMGKSQYPVLFIVALALGSLVGTVLDIDGRAWWESSPRTAWGRGWVRVSSCTASAHCPSLVPSTAPSMETILICLPTPPWIW